MICSVLLLIFCVMPFSAKAADYHLGSREQLESLSVPGVDKVCNFLAWYSLHCFEGDSERAIEQLLALSGEKPAEDSDTIDNNGLLPEKLSQMP